MQNINEIKDQICDVCHKTWQLGWVGLVNAFRKIITAP